MFEIKELTPDQFLRFQSLIYKMCGIRVPETKRTLLSNRIRRRLKACGVDDYEAYFRFVSSPQAGDEMTGFLDAVTTNETSFFRTEKHFDWFRTEFLTEIISQQRLGRRKKQLRLWSAACSTGEEPYSLAICCAENQLRLRDWEIEIVGTDLSSEALDMARDGIYPDSAIDTLETRRRRHFVRLKESGKWQVRAPLRQLITWRRHNLMNKLMVPPFDCVFIRNVLIYFDRDSKQKVVDQLIASLADGGYLVVGPSEGIFDMLDGLQKHSTFLYQK